MESRGLELTNCPNSAARRSVNSNYEPLRQDSALACDRSLPSCDGASNGPAEFPLARHEAPNKAGVLPGGGELNALDGSATQWERQLGHAHQGHKNSCQTSENAEEPNKNGDGFESDNEEEDENINRNDNNNKHTAKRLRLGCQDHIEQPHSNNQQSDHYLKFGQNLVYCQESSQMNGCSAGSTSNNTGTATTSSTSAIDDQSSGHYLESVPLSTAGRQRKAIELGHMNRAPSRAIEPQLIMFSDVQSSHLRPNSDTSIDQPHQKQQQQQRPRQQYNRTQLAADPDQHFYCAVSNVEPRIVYDDRRQEPATNCVDRLQNYYFEPANGGQQRPYQSIYKSPTNLDLNHSYQTLVEKLNENSDFNQTLGRAKRTWSSALVDRRPNPNLNLNHRSNLYSQPPYQATPLPPVPQPFYSNHVNQNQLNQLIGPLLVGQQHNSTTSPLFSSPSRNFNATYSSSSSDNFNQIQTAMSRARSRIRTSDRSSKRKQQDCFLGAGNQQAGLGHFGHAQRPLKWALHLGGGSGPNFCTIRRLFWLLFVLLLLISSLALMSVLLKPSDNRDRAGAQLAGRPIPAGPTPNELLLQFSSPANFLSSAPAGMGRFNYPANQLQQQQQQNVILQQQQQQQANSITASDRELGAELFRWPALNAANWPPLQGIANPPVTSATTTSTSAKPLDELEASTQTYWRHREQANELSSDFCVQSNNCNGNGQCNSASNFCSCVAGHSGPTCSIANCPNECSRRGVCKLRPDWPLNDLASHQSDSLAFQSSSSARWRLSSCSADSPGLNANQTQQVSSHLRRPHQQQQQQQRQLFDSRLQWACDCEAGFGGPDCGQMRELNCQDELDNDHDGLADCEDDDCCSQPACRDNLMCYKPPDPSRVLALDRLLGGNSEFQFDSELLQNRTRNGRLLSQWKFLIANGSVQSYAQEKNFDADRVAIVRGRVVNGVHSSGPGGIVSVRVSVMESAFAGFTLTRQDGFFDLLLNGDEWLTLQFHRNAYAPTKRRLFVRPRTINVLGGDVFMWLSNANKEQTAASQQQQQDQELGSNPESRRVVLVGANNLHLFDLFQSVEQFGQRDDERRRANLFTCLTENLLPPIRAATHNWTFSSSPKPLIQLDDQPIALRQFAFVSQGSSSFQTKFRTDRQLANGTQLSLVYNSAAFGPSSSIAKAAVSIVLLPQKLSHNQTKFDEAAEDSNNFQLKSIELQLDIEGQTRREHFEMPQDSALSYQFAWNRRNVYGQKVYGFAQLNVRVTYEYQLATKQLRQFKKKLEDTLKLCSNSVGQKQHQIDTELRLAIERFGWNLAHKRIKYEGRAFLEAHQMNQHSDLGQWALESSSRLDFERQLLYTGGGRMLPFNLVYPPTVFSPISLGTQGRRVFAPTSAGQLLARGPSSTMFVALLESNENLRSNRLIQLDQSASRRILDVPLAILTSKFQSTNQHQQTVSGLNQPMEDLQLVFNNYESALYIGSKLAGKIVKISMASLSLLNKTLLNGASTLAPDEEIDIEPVCGFGRYELTADRVNALQPKHCKSTRLLGPHSMTLDEPNQLLYLVDGQNSLLVLDLATNLILNLVPPMSKLTETTKSNCLGLNSRLSLSDNLLTTNTINSLAWSQADSSLYLVLDQSAILALRPDSSLQVVALSSASKADHRSSNNLRLPTNRQSTLKDHFCSGASKQLGSIKRVLVDDSIGHELVILHQWQNQDELANHSNSEIPKRAGNFYLAKLSLGLRNEALYDLHSAKSTWNPLIEQFANDSRKHELDIDWDELSRVPNEMDNNGRSKSDDIEQEDNSSKMIPFIHLTNGFDRVDSLEINSEGSIFVLNSQDQSIRSIVAYSPLKFNLVNRDDLSLDRLFATNEFVSSSSSIATTSSAAYSRQVSLPIVSLRNPFLSTELLEFHHSSGLLLGRSQLDSKTRTDFFYRVLSNDNKHSNPQDGPQTVALLDEDDQNDHEIKRLVLDYPRIHPNRSSRMLIASNSYIRLSGIKVSALGSTAAGADLEMSRIYTGTRFVLQSIVNRLSRVPVCEIATDRLGVMSTFIQEPLTRTSWTELVYDPKTYLLRHMVTKTKLIASQAQQQRQQEIDILRSNQPMQSVMFQSSLFPTFDEKLKRTTKRIIYDEIFNHYCDLFTVDT